MKTTQNTQTKTQTPETQTRQTFQDMMHNYCRLYEERQNAPSVNPYAKGTEERAKWNHERNEREDAFNRAEHEFCLACALSVLKKVIDPTRHSAPDGDVFQTQTPDGVKVYTPGDRKTAVNSGFSPALVSLRRQVFGALETLRKEQSTLVDCDDYKTPAKGENLEDGLDLVHDAVVALRAELQRQTERGETPDLERPYTVRRLKRKVYIKDPENLGGYEETETTPIQEIYRAVRRSIQSSRAVQTDPRSGYTYLEDTYTDPDGDGDAVTVYRRLPKYADIGGHVTDGDPDAPVLTKSPDSYGDAKTVTDTDSILEELSLTQRQAQILSYRLRGYGNKAIGTALGVSDKAVKKTKGQIETKWKKTGRPFPAIDQDGAVTWYRQTPDGETVKLEELTALEDAGETRTDIHPETQRQRTAPAVYADRCIPSPAPVRYYERPQTSPVVVDVTDPGPRTVAVVLPSPVVTSPSAFGVMMQNKVVNGALVGRDGKKTDTWL